MLPSVPSLADYETAIPTAASEGGGGSDRPPLTDLAFFGDSFTEGGTDGLSDPSMRFPTQTCALLDVTEHTFGQGGARNWFASSGENILDQVYNETATPDSAPYGSPWQAAVIQASINNLNTTAADNDLTVVTDTLRRSIRRIRSAGSYPKGTVAPWAQDGSWTGDGSRATGDGATATLSVPADFPGGRMFLHGARFDGSGGTETVTLDAAPAGTVDTTTATVEFDDAQPWDLDLGTLTAGTHTVATTIDDLVGFGEFLNGADFETSDTPPLVIVLNTARAPSYPGGTHLISDADVTASNAAVAAMLSSDFPADVVLVDIDALLGNDADNFGPDGIHPNDAGAGLIAAAIAAAVDEHY